MFDQRYSEPGFAYGDPPNDFQIATIVSDRDDLDFGVEVRDAVVSTGAYAAPGPRRRVRRQVEGRKSS